MAKRSRGRPRKYQTNADRQRAYRQRLHAETMHGFDMRGKVAKLRGAIARAKARGELPRRPYSVVEIRGRRLIGVYPGGDGSQEAISEAEVTVLMALAARYASRRYPFGLHIEGASIEGQAVVTLRALPAPQSELS